MFCHEMLAVLFAAPLFPKYWCWHKCLCSSQLKITEENRVGLAVGWQSTPSPGWGKLCVCSSAVSCQCPHSQQLLQGTAHLCGWEMSLWGHPALLWGHFQLLFWVQGALLTSFPGESTGSLCKPGASLPSSHAHVGTANSVLNEGFGINAPSLGPSLQSPGFLITLSLFQCDLGRLSFSYLYFEPLYLHWQLWKSCLKVLNFIWGGLLRLCLNLP